MTTANNGTQAPAPAQHGAEPPRTEDEWVLWLEWLSEQDQDTYSAAPLEVAPAKAAEWDAVLRDYVGLDVSSPMYKGLAGRVVRTLLPYTEATPEALLFTSLTMFGNAVGRGPYMHQAGWHHAQLYTVVVGPTATGAKGTSYAIVVDVMRAADPTWAHHHTFSGVGSGSALAEFLEGVDEHRALLKEEEFSGLLNRMRREGSDLSEMLRDLYDSGNAQVVTRSKPVRVDGAHLSVVAHITPTELGTALRGVDVANGFINRFMFCYSTRSKKLPVPATPPIGSLAEDVAASIDRARTIGEMGWSDDGRDAWEYLYSRLTSTDGDDDFDEVLGRGRAQALRVTMIYALLEGRAEMTAEDVAAASAVLDYSRHSVRQVFGDMYADIGDEVRSYLHDRHDQDVTMTDLNRAFKNKYRAADLRNSVDTLVRRGFVSEETKKQAKRGRPTTVLKCTC